MSENMKNEGLTYEKAVAELNTLVKRVEESDASFEQLEKDIKRAMELINFCKSELRGYKERFDSFLKADNAPMN